MHRQRIFRPLATIVPLLVGVALISSACGSSTPSAAQFNTQANNICKKYSGQLKAASVDLALAKGNGGAKLQSELADALAQLQQGTSSLEGLAKPSGETAGLDAAFKAQNAQVKQLQQLVNALKQKDEEKSVEAESALERSEAPLNQKFDVLGLTACGSGSVPPSNGS